MHSQSRNPRLRRNAVTVTNKSITEINRPVLAVQTFVKKYQGAECESFFSHSINPSTTELSQSNDEKLLSYVYAALLATILEEALACLNILDECNNSIRVKKAALNINRLLAKKYGVEPPGKPDGVIRYPLDSDENKLEKMAADQVLCMETLKQIYAEICINKSYTHLLDFVNQRDIENERLLQGENNKLNIQYRDVKKQHRSQQNVHKLSLLQYDEEISRLQNILEDTELVSNCRNHYATRWQGAQIEQHTQKIYDAQAVSMNSIRYHKSASDGETRAHDEVERYFNVVITEQIQRIDEVMDKYDRDTETIDIEMQYLMSQYAKIRGKRKGMETLIDQRDKAVQSWSKFKEERAAALEHISRMNKSAETVQAWWRGLLVRKQLGPFRPRKEKRGKKKKNDNEKVEDM